MKLGMIGLGRMGANMAQRLLRGGHQVVGFDPKRRSPQSTREQGCKLGQLTDDAGGGIARPAHAVADGAGW